MDKTDISKFKIIEEGKESILEEKRIDEALTIKPEDKKWHIKIVNNKNAEVIIDEDTPSILGVILTDTGAQSLQMVNVTGALSVGALAALMKILDDFKKRKPMVHMLAQMFYEKGGLND